MSVPPLVIGGVAIAPGTRHEISLPVADLYTRTPMTLPVHVICGRTAGPVMFVSAAIHGDEINGVEIIRRLLRLRELARPFVSPSGAEDRIIDRRLQALRKAGRIHYGTRTGWRLIKGSA